MQSLHWHLSGSLQIIAKWPNLHIVTGIEAKDFAELSLLHNYVDIFDGTIDSGCSNHWTMLEMRQFMF